jgi:uncharacterized membrane protein (DUF4010 family)
VGFTDNDLFVLSIVQGNIPVRVEIAQAILIAASSNNVLKAIYALAFGRRREILQPILALLGLAVCSIGAAWLMGR